MAQGTSVHDHALIEATAGIKGARWVPSVPAFSGAFIGFEAIEPSIAILISVWIDYFNLSAFGIGTKNTLYIRGLLL